MKTNYRMENKMFDEIFVSCDKDYQNLNQTAKTQIYRDAFMNNLKKYKDLSLTLVQWEKYM
jgi:hypothetical protein